jgi:hypothetical protein
LEHLVIENRPGLIVDAMASTADGRAEREVATVWLHERVTRRGRRRRTVGAGKGYDTRAFVELTRELGYTPHATQNVTRAGGSALDSRTTRHGRLRQESVRPPAHRTAFGWLKTIAWLREVKLRGLSNIHWLVCFAAAAFNLRRLTTLTAAPA